MPTNIHPTAIIESGAQLDDDVTVGAYAYIGARVEIGRGSIIHHHATVERRTIMGECNEVHPYSHIGGMTQDLKYSGGEPGLLIGNNNIFREFTSMHIATRDGDFTVIGNNNVFLNYSHVAHECHVGNHVILSSSVALGGHVTIEDYAIISWSTGIHQFCRVGQRAFVGANSLATQDILPFMLAEGSPAGTRTVNKVGLQRAGYSDKEILTARRIYKALYRENLNRSQAIEKIHSSGDASTDIGKTILDFIKGCKRGLA